MLRIDRLLGTVLALALAAPAAARVATGSITGTVKDASGALLPGVNVTLSGEHLIGGAQTQPTSAGGGYRFDRLAPGVATCARA